MTLPAITCRRVEMPPTLLDRLTGVLFLPYRAYLCSKGWSVTLSHPGVLQCSTEVLRSAYEQGFAGLCVPSIPQNYTLLSVALSPL